MKIKTTFCSKCHRQTYLNADEVTHCCQVQGYERDTWDEQIEPQPHPDDFVELRIYGLNYPGFRFAPNKDDEGPIAIIKSRVVSLDATLKAVASKIRG